MNTFEHLLSLFLISAVSTGLFLPFLVKLFTKTGWVGENYLKEKVPTGIGLSLLLGPTLSWLWYLLLATKRADFSLNSTLMAAAGVMGFFALLGFVDDQGGSGEHGGFRYHLSTMLQGNLTTGGLKALGGGFAAIYFALAVSESNLELVIGGLVISFSANLINLLDLRPGRAIKGYLVLTIIALFSGGVSSVTGVVAAAALGAVLAVAFWDFQGKLMLGDAGANLLGALAGFQILISGDRIVLTISFLLIAGLNLLAEKVSLSQVITNSTVLSWLDQLGRVSKGGNQ